MNVKAIDYTQCYTSASFALRLFQSTCRPMSVKVRGLLTGSPPPPLRLAALAFASPPLLE